MSRIPAVKPQDASPLVRIAYWYAKRQVGEVPEPFAVLANHRKLFVASARHELAVQEATKVVPPELIQLAVYRTAWTVGCSWCVDFGAMLMRLEELDIDRLKEIGSYETSDRFSADDRLVIAYSDSMTATPTAVTDEQVKELRARFGNAGVVELTYQIALENQRSRMNSALGITDQGFTSGDACRVPWAMDEPASQRA
ncbi:MAG: carboxymuconolactone decarboxylase family protein [Actinomycetota bacterium]|nr:carboxymuconolactone decarboxylase family protein [Actinomycetota bacterium]